MNRRAKVNFVIIYKVSTPKTASASHTEIPDMDR